MSTPKKNSFLNPIISFFSPAAGRPVPVEDIPDEDSTDGEVSDGIEDTATTSHQQETTIVRMARQAKAIDDVIKAKREEEAEATLLDPKRKIKFMPNIGPKYENYVEMKRKFQSRLQGQEAISSILEEFFEESQILFLQPPPNDGVILAMQTRNAEEYKVLLRGPFSSEKDNLITKLTMLHFGLPVEALTMNNILNAGKDEEDPADAPEKLPRVQRITFAEKPLEFLDTYHERSYGLPILRSKFSLPSSTP